MQGVAFSAMQPFTVLSGEKGMRDAMSEAMEGMGAAEIEIKKMLILLFCFRTTVSSILH